MCVWIIDADAISFDDDFHKYIYETPVVKEFLSDRKLGICSNKGVGKTYLLKLKRYILQNSGIQCLPNDKMVDCITNIEINNRIRKYFSNFFNWRNLWIVSIFISLSQNIEEFEFDISEFNSKNIFNKLIQSVNLKKCRFSVSSIVQHLLHFSNKDIGILLQESGKYLSLLQQINHGIALFIDKVDQALSRELNVSENKSNWRDSSIYMWKISQLSLMDVAYAIYNTNNHIKINFAIRPESFDGTRDVCDTLKQSEGQVVKLKYSKNELRGLFESYIKKEKETELVKPEATNSFEKLVGFSKLEHSYHIDKIEEDVFDYIYRHTFGTSRDLMIIGNALYLSRVELGTENAISHFKQTINKLSQDIMEYYTGELVHLSGLSKKEFEVFSKQFNFNIFNQVYLEIILRNYVKEYNETYDKSINIENAKQTFLKFLNLGIIGYSRKYNNEDRIMYFEDIQEETTNLNQVPQSSFYILHPCLSDYVNEQQTESNRKYNVCKYIIVGNEYRFNENYIPKIKALIRKFSAKLPKLKIFVSSTCYDLDSTRDKIRKEIIRLKFDPVMSDYNDSDFLINIENHSHDACIKAIENTDAVIFIQSRRYGSMYAGTKYKYISDEIKKIVPELSKPSISLVELYRALEMGKRCYIYIDSRIVNERLTFKKQAYQDNFKPAFADKKEVYYIIDFINHNPFNSNNWSFYYYEEKNIDICLQFKKTFLI